MAFTKFLAAGVVAGGLAAALPGGAQANDQVAIHAIQNLRVVTKVDVIDVAAQSDRFVNAKRAMQHPAPLTPLQAAIADSAPLVRKIDTSVWSFDIHSVYAANVVGSTVYIYLGWPPI